jgi:nucleoside-diphosphate-sugar epimerase
MSPSQDAPPVSETVLDEALSRPTAADAQAMAALEGDILILGAGGKMGPSLARLARRASDEAGIARRVVAVSRFGIPSVADALEREGVDTIACDLLDARALDDLPDAPNLVFMAGQKFGAAADPIGTWAVNALLPVTVIRRFGRARIVVFSTGNVYPLVPVDGGGAREEHSLEPVGEYAQSALARERLVTYLADRQGTPTAILRLNYAVEPRYGVLRDLADRIVAGAPIDCTMGWVNVIWQRDANAIALGMLAHATVPPAVLNVTGAEALRVRDLATRIGERLGTAPRFTGEEAETALLSDAARCWELFGPPIIDPWTACDLVADWVRAGGRSLGKPTHYEQRDGTF